MSQWFRWLSTSNLVILHWMLHNSQTSLYSAPYTFSPTTVSAQRMPSELSTDSTKTSTSSDSSTATSKVHVKPITRLLSQNILNIVHSLFSWIFSISAPSTLSLLHFFHFLFSSILVLTPFTWVFVLLCNDPPRRYSIHTLIFDNFNFYKMNSLNFLLWK